jgi:hypothetical protein
MKVHFERVLRACRLDARETDRLSGAVSAILAQAREPLTGEALRGLMPRDFVRDLGPEGKRFGESSTLSFVLRRLQVEGKAVRVSLTQRLDQARYGYRSLDIRPLEGRALFGALVRRYLEWAGPATLKDLAWWAGVAQREARAGLEALDVAAVRVEGWAREAWILAEDLPRLRARPRTAEQGIVFLPFRDNYLYLRRGMGVLLGPEARDAVVRDWRGRPARLADSENLHQHAVIAEGRLVAVWDFDADAGRVEWAPLGDRSAQLARSIEKEAGRVGQFVRDELGDLRFYAADGARQRKDRLAALRAMKG